MEYNNLDLIQNKAKKLLSDLKEDHESSFVSSSQILVVVLFTASIIVLYIVGIGVTKCLVFMLILIGFLLWHRIKLNSVVKESVVLSSYKKIAPEDKQNFTSGMLKYLSSGYNIKITRLSSVRIFFCVVFPLLLVLFKELYQYFFQDGLSGTSVVQYVIAYLIGGTFWFNYFKKDIKELELDKTDVDLMTRKLLL